MPFLPGFKLIKKAHEEYVDSKLWEMYLVIYPWMDKDNFKSFDEFKSSMKPKAKEQTTDEMLSVVKLLNAAFGGEVVELYG